jgi:hypothetical protein
MNHIETEGWEAVILYEIWGFHGSNDSKDTMQSDR